LAVGWFTLLLKHW